MEPTSVTYRLGHGIWGIFFSPGERLTVTADPNKAGLAEARAVVRRHAAGRAIGVERVDVTTSTVDWHGLRFEPLTTTHGLEGPSAAQADQLWVFEVAA